MADPKRRPSLIAVDENYVAPENANADERGRANAAAFIKEGRRRQKIDQEKALAALRSKQDAETQLVLQGVKSAHVDELNRSGKIVAKAAHRDGVLQGIVIGMIAAICTGLATWTVLREVVITNVSTQRVPMAGDGVPELQVPESTSRYERAGREPGDAH